MSRYFCMFRAGRRLTISAQTMWLQLVAVAIVGVLYGGANIIMCKGPLQASDIARKLQCSSIGAGRGEGNPSRITAHVQEDLCQYLSPLAFPSQIRYVSYVCERVRVCASPTILHSLASQTQPARIAFSITHDTESDPRWGWLGLACETLILQWIMATRG